MYRATDTSLGRQVAIKVLPEAFAQDAERLARFEREAKTLASLNHPNIAAIHAIEKSGGITALVMELVEGDDLSQRIARGAIPIDEALPIAKQIAEALEAAHEQTIIHRDLKPANIKVRSDGTVKVLDFGLAKALAADPVADMSNSPTLSLAMTQAGMILGTAAYMSPEQAKGRATDKRTDIWAFGAVLYEMLTGNQAFGASDVSEALAAVIRVEPDWKNLPADLHPRLKEVLRRCLAKDVSRRFRDIGDVRSDIEHILSDPSGVIVPRLVDVVQATRPSKMPWVAAFIVGSLVTGIAVWTFTRPDVVPADVMRFVIAPSDDTSLIFNPGDRDLVISPDGRRIVYNGRGDEQLYLRPIDEAIVIPLRVTAGRTPFFSPDGAWVGFTDSDGRTLQKVSIFGGPPVTLATLPGNMRGASWGADDQIILGTSNGGLFRVSGGGGEPEAVTTLKTELGGASHTWPFRIPGRKAVLFVLTSGPSPLTTGQLAVLDLDTGAVTRLGLAGVSPHYVSTGHLVYAVEDGSLRAVPFDVASLQVTGNPVPLVEGVVVKNSGAANFSLSHNGRLVYVVGAAGVQNQLAWVDRGGREEPIAAPPRGYTYPRISPDGKRVAIDVRDKDNDIWIWDFARLTRLTFDAAVDQWPTWTPDGLRLVFASSRGGSARNIYEQAADGTGMVARLTTSEHDQVPYALSPDGSVLLLFEITGANDISLLAREPKATPKPLFHTTFSERNPELSPDGRWVAYESNDSGRYEVFVQPFPDVDGGRWQVSTSGGTVPLWSPDGKELYYAETPGRLMVVPVEATRGFTSGVPKLLLEYSGAYSNFGRTYDIAPDGQRFLVVKNASSGGDGGGSSPEIQVVLNWTEELKRRVPTN